MPRTSAAPCSRSCPSTGSPTATRQAPGTNVWNTTTGSYGNPGTPTNTSANQNAKHYFTTPIFGKRRRHGMVVTSQTILECATSTHGTRRQLQNSMATRVAHWGSPTMAPGLATESGKRRNPRHLARPHPRHYGKIPPPIRRNKSTTEASTARI